jgi:hypothetical protein
LLCGYINWIRRWAIHYYLARDLADRLDVNLAKWKRWSREFLPPDPLGGLQSGFARQYSLKEAFLVALGGFLVGELKFAVPEARVILKDLGAWLKRAGYLRRRPNGGLGEGKALPDTHAMIFVRPKSGDGGGYLYWWVSLGDGRCGQGVANDLDEAAFFSVPGVRVINLGAFAKRFYDHIS